MTNGDRTALGAEHTVEWTMACVAYEWNVTLDHADDIDDAVQELDEAAEQ
ncbi:hypothetical protein [Streptomonospora sediminis]